MVLIKLNLLTFTFLNNLNYVFLFEPRRHIFSVMPIWVVLFCFLTLCSASDYITQSASFSNNSDAGLTYHTQSKMYNGYNTNAYYAWVSNPIPYFRVLYPTSSNGSCEGYLRPSRVAKEQNCQYATNGGPFVMYQLPGNPTCLGNIVSDGNVVQVQSTSNTNFGLTKDGEFVLGVLDSSDIQSLDFEQLITGFGWLIREGVNQVTSSGGEIAPRTAIGTNSKGNLILFEADGVEQEDIGLTLQQLADWMIDLGVYSAVNLDGGGSSVTVVNGTIVDHPSCRDTSTQCERFVTTMTCIM